MPQKSFRLSAAQIKPVAIGFGSCFATDRITVDGAQVGYCDREDPSTATDSGWRFFAGDESDEYANNPANLVMYDVNTVANYDPTIATVLEAPCGSAFERNSSGLLVPAAASEA